MNEKLIERLKKLLALAGNNSSQAEAHSAMGKAQALAIEHGIDLAMIGVDDENETEIIRETMEFGQRLPTVSNYVGAILVNHFNIRLITTGNRAMKRGLVFIGKQDDVQTAKYIFTWLSDTMIRCWHNYYKQTPGVELDHKQSYLNGFYNGLNSKLTANKQAIENSRLKNEEDKNKYALVVVNLQSKIQAFIDENIKNLHKSPVKKIKADYNSYAKGISDGGQCNIAKGGISNRETAKLQY